MKRAFLLVDTGHGLKDTDKELLRLLRQQGVSHQVVLSKADRVIFSGPGTPNTQQLGTRSEILRQICQDIHQEIQPPNSDGPVALGEIIACSAERSFRGKRLGINNLRWAVLAATGAVRSQSSTSIDLHQRFSTQHRPTTPF